MKAKINHDVFIKTTNKGRGVFTSQNFKKAETVVIGRQVEVVPGRTIYSLQMGIDLHVQIDEPARVINHSCNPNTGVRNNQFGGYDFIALKDIAEGEEITFDYETTEYISMAVSECLCGATNCRGKTRGFLYLPTAIRKKYGEYIADYLKPIRAMDERNTAYI